MKCPRFHLFLLPWYLSFAEPRMRGEREGRRFLLGNVFDDAAALRHSLSTQRAPYQDPFRDEPSIKNLATRKHAREREFRKMMSAKKSYYYEYPDETIDEATYETAADATHEEPTLDLHLPGKGKHKSMMKSKGKSMGMGKGMGKSMGSKSKMKSKGKGMGMSYYHVIVPEIPSTEHPTSAPSQHVTETEAPTPTPILTEHPTCPPTKGLFPPDVSGFFQAPTGEEPNDLQQELNNALTEIQVPSEFEEQCVER